MRVLKFFLGVPAKIKIYVALALLGITLLAATYRKGGSDRDVSRLKDRMKAIKNKQEVTKDVNTRDDDELIDGITRRK